MSRKERAKTARTPTPASEKYSITPAMMLSTPAHKLRIAMQKILRTVCSNMRSEQSALGGWYERSGLEKRPPLHHYHMLAVIADLNDLVVGANGP
jgi:hypothetical protein